MNRLMFEGRFLVNIAGSIIRQDDLHIVHSRIDWERMYRIADYHKIANIIYLGLLGNREALPERWQNRFFERYQESLRFGEVCDEAEKEVLALLDMKGIPCIILSSGDIRELYQIKETAANSSLRVYMNSDSYAMAKGYLVDLGYETDMIYTGYGERMQRVSGLSVEIYHSLPFRTRLYKLNMLNLMKNAYIKTSYRFIRTLSLEDRFIFRMAQVSYRYATDELLLRDVLDLFLYHKAWRDQMNAEYIKKKLSVFHIEELSDKILRLSYMWYGTKEDKRFEQPLDDTAAYDVLENRILSRGLINKETDHQAIGLSRLIQRDINQAIRKEKLEVLRRRLEDIKEKITKKLRWAFPEYKYMCAVYPVLEKVPVLLPLYWLVRGTRLLLGLLFANDITP